MPDNQVGVEMGMDATFVAAVVMWGTGTPMAREFLHVDVLADVCLFLMETYSDEMHVNLGTGVDLEIRELAAMIKEVVGFQGEIVQDLMKPDGTPRKLTDVYRLNGLGWKAKIALREGIEETVQQLYLLLCCDGRIHEI